MGGAVDFVPLLVSGLSNGIVTVIIFSENVYAFSPYSLTTIGTPCPECSTMPH